MGAREGSGEMAYLWRGFNSGGRGGDGRPSPGYWWSSRFSRRNQVRPPM